MFAYKIRTTIKVTDNANQQQAQIKQQTVLYVSQCVTIDTELKY